MTARNVKTLDPASLPKTYAKLLNDTIAGRFFARVVAAYHVEFEASRKIGYVAQRFDDLDYDAYGEPAE